MFGSAPVVAAAAMPTQLRGSGRSLAPAARPRGTVRSGGCKQLSGAPRCQKFSKLELFIVFDSDTSHIPKEDSFLVYTFGNNRL